MDSSSMGFTEMILVLMALGGFGAAANPGAPSASEVLRYAPETTDIVAHMDIEAVVPRNYEVFRHLPDAPELRGLTDVQRQLASVVKDADKELADLKKKSGLDVIHDLRSVTVFVTLNEQGPPSFLFAVRGTFKPDLFAKVMANAKGEWKADKVGGKPALMSTDGMALATLASDGVMLAGTPAWVRERAGAWTPRENPVAAETRAALDEKPIFLVASRPHPPATRLIERELSDPDVAFLRDLLLGHVSAGVAVSWNGAWWSYTAVTAAGYQRASMATDGIIQLLRAGHLGLRGFARLGLSLVDSYTALDPTVAKIAAHKNDLLRIVDTWTGDGSFNASVERKDGEQRVSVRLLGKSLSEVLPVAGMFMLGAIFVVMR